MVRKRMPPVDATVASLSAACAEIIRTTKQSFVPGIPESDAWIEPVTQQVILLWRRTGKTVAPQPSPAQLKAFACAILRWLGMPCGLVISGVPVIEPVAECIQHGVSDLDVKRIVDIQCRNVHQMSKAIKKALAGVDGLLA